MYKINELTNQITIDKKVFDFDEESYKDDQSIHINVDEKQLFDTHFDIENFPNKLLFEIHDTEGFGTYFFYDLEFGISEGELIFVFTSSQPNKFWDGKWGLSTFIAALNETIQNNDDLEGEVIYVDIDDSYKEIQIQFTCKDSFEYSNQVRLYATILNKYLKDTENILAGIIWRKEFEKDESLFCTDIIYPLLRKMKFIDVRFTHGKKEYGKDFTFSEITKFGNLRHYAIQAKAGNIRGNVNSDINEILGQLEDAFSMPYYEVSANETRNINTFVVAISGNFTENAKEKISNKMPPHFKGSVYFLDKEKILELIDKYWK